MLSPELPGVRAVLEGLGFEVEEGVAVKGLSGYVHTYEFRAARGGRALLVSVKPADPKLLLLELARALDVREEVLLLVRGRLPPGFKDPPNSRVKLVTFESLRELEEELKKIL